MSSILVSADLRVGLGYPDVPERGRELREARIDTVRELINVANHRRVDAVVLAGNTLADNRIDQHDLLDLVDALRLSEAPVLILPGATDPFTPDSPYRARSELFEAPIRVMGDSHPVRLSDLTIAPYP
ncbi:MAG: hypothetical protein KC910_32195, partial [Candidatus Eremiobacteraeota bacterium]|nr:hypothetical protein [Candidatus Eremiobacteraeota bacterium]